jgi:accessory gene regulator protein AgrB
MAKDRETGITVLSILLAVAVDYILKGMGINTDMAFGVSILVLICAWFELNVHYPS